jgi:putative chitinase
LNVITEQQLAAIIPTNKQVKNWHAAIVNILPKYNINTTDRIASFLAQCAHESRDFTSLEENLNYSAERLLQVFPRYFGAGKANAADFARNPQKLANYVYMDINRSTKGALGNINNGDGWLFRGRGIKQLTGRNNYAAFGATIGMTAEQTVEYISTEKGAIESACWFWKARNLNAFADKKDIVGMTKAINGGEIGIADRRARWEKALKILT